MIRPFVLEKLTLTSMRRPDDGQVIARGVPEAVAAVHTTVFCLFLSFYIRFCLRIPQMSVAISSVLACSFWTVLSSINDTPNVCYDVSLSCLLVLSCFIIC